MGFDIKINHQRIQTTRSHAPRCHHCNYCHYGNVDFVLFHNVRCNTNYLLSCICVNIAKLLNTTSTLVATSLILRSLECIFFELHRMYFSFLLFLGFSFFCFSFPSMYHTSTHVVHFTLHDLKPHYHWFRIILYIHMGDLPKC